MFNQFSPYMPQYQPQQAAFTPAPIQIPSQPQTPSTVVLYAPTAKDFPSVSIQPGKNALVIAQNEPFMCFKSADAMGMVQSTLYRIEQISEQNLAAPTTEYATKDEFIQLKQVVKQIVDRISPPKEENK